MATLSVLVLCCILAGCGGVEAEENGDVTITVASRNYSSEERILREVYAHALEVAGFKVKRHDPESGLPSEELEKGKISGYPDYLDTALAEVASIQPGSVPGSPALAYDEVKRELGKKGLVAFSPASIMRANGVAVLKATARRHGLKTIADLKGRSGGMTIQGHSLCHISSDCLLGLEVKYGIAFKWFSTKEPPALLYKALRSGEADAVMLATAEGRLAEGKDWLVLLEDEDHRLPAASAFWVTSQEVVDEAGPEYEKAILNAQNGLTLQVMRELSAAVELEGKPPAEAVAEYVKSIR